MSMRQAKKLLQKEDEMEAYRKAVEEEKLESKQTKKTSAFAGFSVDSDSEQEQEEETPKVEKKDDKPKPTQEPTKKKKNKKKKNKKAKQEVITE